MSRDLAGGLFWLAIGLFAALQGWTLKLGSLNRPGPGFFPFWGGIVLGALALILLINSLRRPATRSPSPIRWAPLFIVMGAVLAYFLLLETLGFLIVTFLFLLLLFRLGQTGWVRSAGWGFAATLGAYALFKVWLHTQLPQGPFGF